MYHNYFIQSTYPFQSKYIKKRWKDTHSKRETEADWERGGEIIENTKKG